MPESESSSTTIGVAGGSWRADVTPWGALRLWDDGGVLDWWIAADDRWYDPATETTVRQRRVEGVPVIETRLRVPGGDVVHRVHAVADAGGHTVIEVANESSLPVALAVHGVEVQSVRPPADVPIAGITLPAGTVTFPIGHHSSTMITVAHERRPASGLPSGLASAESVVRGWRATCHRASRLDLPDANWTERVIAARCELVLAGPVIDDPVAMLLGVGELVRMGSPAAPWVTEVAEVVAGLDAHRTDPLIGAALDAAGRVCRAAHEDRAVRDLAQLRRRFGVSGCAVPTESIVAAIESAAGARLVCLVERYLADGGDLLSHGVPESWWGLPLEVFDVPVGTESSVSFALRWHGARPAVLWECRGAPVRLTARAAAPSWSSEAASGEALWPAPQSFDATPTSFS